MISKSYQDVWVGTREEDRAVVVPLFPFKFDSNLKLLASTVAKIHRGSQIIFGCSPSPYPHQFWSKMSFFGKLVPKIRIEILKYYWNL